MAMANKPFMLQEAELNSLYRYGVMLSRHRDDAYDLLQSALEKYLVEIRRGRDNIDNPSAYIRTLMRNRYIDQYRHQQRWPQESFEDSASYDISPLDVEQVSTDSETLERVWAELSLEDRDILYHWAVLGYSTDEVCAQLEMPRGTLLSRIHRLRKKLQGLRRDQAAGEPES